MSVSVSVVLARIISVYRTQHMLTCETRILIAVGSTGTQAVKLKSNERDPTTMKAPPLVWLLATNRQVKMLYFRCKSAAAQASSTSC